MSNKTPIVFVPTWVADSFKNHNVALKHLCNAQVLESVLNNEDIISYSKFNSLTFIREILAETANEISAHCTPAVVYKYDESMRCIDSNKDNGKIHALGNLTNSFINYLQYGNLDKKVWLTRMSPIASIVNFKKGTDLLIERSSVNSNNFTTDNKKVSLKTNTKLSPEGENGVVNIPGVEQEFTDTIESFNKYIFDIKTINGIVYVFIGSDYFDYVKHKESDRYRIDYDLTSVMPESSQAKTLGSYLTLSILQELINNTQDKDYLDSWVYEYYIGCLQPK